ncbi:N-acetylneuraminate synthase family protein [Desulfosporosinus nitroreducens]|uniref:N-acetylneuraminate synthase family protein n=1 Tax=Desulfosporosinus nitroreducens TaxID=2018668 RepID=UPI00207C98B3|nr:N-acetylneuraminate synthase family protein [Desulfosporosinus nitroreducens]MCO1603823.1 N-acetylneuraminate synthase family protein [Desulfosporosinus nitroreducens]
MATVAELDETVRVARESGCPDVILFKCTRTSNLLTTKKLIFSNIIKKTGRALISTPFL